MSEAVANSDDLWQARQTALADFGIFALGATDPDELFHEACRQVARGLQVDMAKLATLEPSGDLRLRGAVGLPAGLATPAVTIIPGGEASALGYAVKTGVPVISQVASETRFDPSEVVRKAGVVTSANVVLWVDGARYGSLEADSLREWQVTEAEVSFLQAYGNLVAAAIQRHRLSERVTALAHEREVLLNEVLHRIKNMLSNIDAIARRTVRYSSSLDDFLEAFSGRLGALSRAQDLLLMTPSKPASLRELFAVEFEAKGLVEGEQFRADGAEVFCNPRTIQAMALLLFELSTNAAKYGALSREAEGRGFIGVDWTVEEQQDGPHVTLQWRERGLNSLQPPKRKGFGSELIERQIPSMLNGEISMSYHPDGIECLVRFPLA